MFLSQIFAFKNTGSLNFKKRVDVTSRKIKWKNCMYFDLIIRLFI